MPAPHPAGIRTEINKAVVPVAGLGTRLRPLTTVVPKELLPLGRKPALAHIAVELRAAGITQALFIISESKPQIRAFLGDSYVDEEMEGPLQCDYAVQVAPRGSGDAVLCAEAWAGGTPFVVAFGDCLMVAPQGDSAGPLRRLIAAHEAHRAGATILVEPISREKVSRYGIVAPEGAPPFPSGAPFPLAGIVEKPAPEEAPSTLAVAARFVLTPAIFTFLRCAKADPRGELNLPDAVHALRKAGHPVWAVVLYAGERRQDIGNFEDYFAAFTRAALRDDRYGAAARRAAKEALGEAGPAQ